MDAHRIGTLPFVLRRDDVAGLTTALPRVLVDRIFGTISIALGVVCFGLLAFNPDADAHARLSLVFRGAVSLFVGFVALVKRPRIDAASPIVAPELGRDATVVFDELGVTVTTRGRPVHHGWSVVRAVSPRSGGLRVDVKYDRPILIPARALPDGGRAMLAFAATHRVEHRLFFPKPVRAASPRTPA